MKKIGLIFCFLFLNVNAENFFWFSKNGSEELSLVSKEYVRNAQNNHWDLNTSIYYEKNTLFDDIKKCSEVKLLFRNPKSANIDQFYWIKKGKNKAVVIVPPYGSDFTAIKHLLAVFEDYDIFLYVYKKTPGSTLKKAYSFLTALSSKTFGDKVSEFCFLLSTGGFTYCFEKNLLEQYEEVIGFGQCYGSWILLHAQQQLVQAGQKGFDKFILDSCPVGTYELQNKFIKDPISIVSKGKKEGPFLLSYCTDSFLCRPFLKYVAQKICDDICIKTLLETITVPTLFIHGESDFLVTTNELKLMCGAVNCEKSYALITPYRHLVHSLKAKEVYCQTVNDFIEGRA
jgi:hypothetical protein